MCDTQINKFLHGRLISIDVCVFILSSVMVLWLNKASDCIDCNCGTLSVSDCTLLLPLFLWLKGHRVAMCKKMHSAIYDPATICSVLSSGKFNPLFICILHCVWKKAPHNINCYNSTKPCLFYLKFYTPTTYYWYWSNVDRVIAKTTRQPFLSRHNIEYTCMYVHQSWYIFGSHHYLYSALTLLVGRQDQHPACKN